MLLLGSHHLVLQKSKLLPYPKSEHIGCHTHPYLQEFGLFPVFSPVWPTAERHSVAVMPGLNHLPKRLVYWMPQAFTSTRICSISGFQPTVGYGSGGTTVPAPGPAYKHAQVTMLIGSHHLDGNHGNCESGEPLLYIWSISDFQPTVGYGGGGATVAAPGPAY